MKVRVTNDRVKISGGNEGNACRIGGEEGRGGGGGDGRRRRREHENKKEGGAQAKNLGLNIMSRNLVKILS